MSQTAAPAAKAPDDTDRVGMKMKLDRIDVASTIVAAKEKAYREAREDCTNAQAAWKESVQHLLRVIRNATEPELPYDEHEDDAFDEDEEVADEDPFYTSLPWQHRPISVLEFTDATMKALAKESVHTCGELDVWLGSRELKDLRGVGEKKAAAAIEKWSAFLFCVAKKDETVPVTKA